MRGVLVFIDALEREFALRRCRSLYPSYDHEVMNVLIARTMSGVMRCGALV